MLDSYEKLILSYIASECGDSYKVIEIEDFESFYKPKVKKKKLNIPQILKKLQSYNYISIKYYDDNKFCLALSPQSKQLFEEDNFKKYKIKKIKYETAIVLLLIFLFAFIGSFLGTLLYNLIL